MTETQLALLADNSLSDTARMIGLWVSLRESGDDRWVELTFDDVRVFLHDYPPDSAIRRHLSMLTGSGWLERKPGGRGHGDRFRLQPRSTLSDRLGRSLTLKPDSLQPRSSLSDTVVRSTVVRSTSVDDSGAHVEQFPYQISEKAEAAIIEYGDDLSGCRGALRDYLRASVVPPRQYGYVQTIATWIAGTDRSVFQLSDGGQLPEVERAGYLAAAMNELMAGGETSMKQSVGHPGNLKTKLNILLKQRDYGGHRNGTTHRRSSPGSARGEAPVALNPIRGEREPDTRFD